MNAVAELNSLRTHAESIANDGDHHIETMSPDDGWAQGDILIVSLESVPPRSTLIEPSKQLAPGTTQGSRHCLRNLRGIRLHRLADATPLDGAIIEAKSAFWVDHPEHGNVCLPPGVYGVVFQRAYAEELRRVQD